MYPILSQQIADDRLSHAYLLLGREDSLLREEAEEIGKRLKIKPADLLILEGEKIKIDQIRGLIHQVSLKPHSSSYKLVIISQAENLTLEASNALLKILEEPPCHSIIVLLAHHEKNLLPTIVSRCQRMRIRDEFREELEPEWINVLKEINKMSIKEKFDLAQKLSQDRNLARILDQWLIFYRRRLLKGEEISLMIEKISRARRLLKTNINTRLLLENLLLELY